MLFRSRFATDDVEIEFESPLLATCRFNFEEAEAESDAVLATAGSFSGAYNAAGVLA